MNVTDIRNHFPILSEKLPGGQDLVYLDNAATSQRPNEVIDKYLQLSTRYNANIHRAVHYLAVEATDQYEKTREAVKDFIGAESAKEIIFTSGTTASINTVAYSYGEVLIGRGDNIIVSQAEHHSNIVPWQLLAERKGAEIRVLPVDDDGRLRIELLPGLIDKYTRLIAVCHISNVLGLVNPVREIAEIAHKRGVHVLVDGAQGIVHENVNVKDLDCDFYVFSGHKMFAVPFTGVLYGKKEILDCMPPFLGGGEMIESVSLENGTTFAPLPGKFEAGTQNISGTPTLTAAIDLCKQLRDKEITDYQQQLAEYVMDALMSDERITLYGVPRGNISKIPLFSFTVKGAHHEDLALILDKMGIAVRSGQMCAEPLMDRFGVTGMVRASFAAYNTLEEARYFIKSLDRAIKMLV
ncbi:MAG: SufS family cysteine desulfurase [Bacteroidales bacterium]|nr:SufS family cysteine desulfurase [Bacteroidales bacterium]